MKWSEFKKLVDAEVSRNSGLSIYNPFDPEIDFIDVDMNWRPYEKDIMVRVRMTNGKIKIRRI